MGTVHAKSVDAVPDEEERGSRVDLQGLKAQVQRVHVSGLDRTKEDIVISSVRDVFGAKDFQTVILKIHEARTRLEGLGCFKGVGVVIDTYLGMDALDDGIQVTFEVEELKLVGGRVNTMVGTNEGILSLSGGLRNVFGRGEELNANYSRGSKKTTSFTGNFVKPFHNETKTKLSVSAYQSFLEAGWADYKQLDRGVLLGMSFSIAPNVTQQLILDTAWRNLSCLSKNTSFAVREHCGHTLKNALRHEITIDTRNDGIFPSEGHVVKMRNEIAGLGGNIGFLKNEASWHGSIQLPFELVVQSGVSVGHLLPLNGKSTSICDKFVLGGPMTFRGFQLGGIGPHSDTSALGGETFWNAGMHLLSPLPLLPHGSFTDRFRLHVWANLGNIGDWKMDGDSRKYLSSLFKDVRLSYGAGLALNVGGLARIELNYCIPLYSKRGDKLQHGVQFGIAADM